MRWFPLTLLLLGFAAACGGGGAPEGGAYIALGDSLSTGVGASDPATTAFVPLVHESLGPGFELLNLGHSGDTSQKFLDHGHLDQAVNEITRRHSDRDPNNDVKLVTLEIGSNDLLALNISLVVSGTCPDLQAALQKRECREPLSQALQRFEPNLRTILARLREADPQVPIVLVTLYNPVSGRLSILSQLAEMVLEGQSNTPFPEGINDIIRTEGQEEGVILVDLYPLFEGKASELISQDSIHPNDEGYRVMAEAVIHAIEEAR